MSIKFSFLLVDQGQLVTYVCVASMLTSHSITVAVGLRTVAFGQLSLKTKRMESVEGGVSLAVTSHVRTDFC